MEGFLSFFPLFFFRSNFSSFFFFFLFFQTHRVTSFCLFTSGVCAYKKYRKEQVLSFFSRAKKAVSHLYLSLSLSLSLSFSLSLSLLVSLSLSACLSLHPSFSC